MQKNFFDPPEVVEVVSEGAYENIRPDLQRLKIMALGQNQGRKYCFAHDRFEDIVRVYLVGKRYMFLCPEAAAERGGVLHVPSEADWQMKTK